MPTAPSNLSATTASSSRINLAWTNAGSYGSIEVRRGTSSPPGTLIATLSGRSTSYSDTTCQDGTLYYYQLTVVDAGDNTATSNIANATTTLPAPSGLKGTASASAVALTWNDNSQHETGFKVYKNGSLLATLGANVESYSATGLTAGTYYDFYVVAYNSAITSSATSTLHILTADPPAAPDTLTATATATTKVRLNWVDNADNESDFHIEQSTTSASAGFAEITTVAANITTYEVTSLTSNTQYWFRVVAHNDSGYSGYSNVATAVTFAAIAAPTNLVVANEAGCIDLYFDDNSELEDYHCVERKTGAGAYSEIVQLEPNRNAYRDTDVSDGTLYTYKVRAKQGASSYSSYCDEVAVTTISAPAAPTGLAISEYQDTWMRVSWTQVADPVVGYKIEQSPDNVTFTEIASLPFHISSYKVPNLTPGTTYYFQVRCWNSNGTGSYSAVVSGTTRASYSFSTFQRLIRKSSPNLIYLVEINPAVALQGWALSSGQTYTYETGFDERGAEIDSIEENGVALTEKTSIATVEATAGTWWHDAATAKVYVHPSGDDSPNNYYLVGNFWLYFTTWTEKTSLTVFNDHCYLPIVAPDGIPDISQEISPYYEGNFVISSGSVSFLNGKINRANYWDAKCNRYLFINRKVKILAGGKGFTYSEFQTVNTGIVDGYICDDRRITFNLRDYRSGINRNLPVDKYTTAEFAALDSQAIDKPKPFAFGSITNAGPVCIDTTNRIFELHSGNRIKSVEYVYQNGTELTAGTDYFIDYERGRIILARGLAYTSDDIILVDFTGTVVGSGLSVTNGALIFQWILNNYLDVSVDDLDMDSICATYLDKTTALSLYVWKDTDSQDLIRRIERSIQAYTFQNAEGKLGIKPALTTAPSDIFYIPNSCIFDFSMEKNKASLFSTIDVFYKEDPSRDKYAFYQCINSATTYRQKVVQQLPPIYTALTTEAQAAALGANIIALLDKAKITFTVNRNLFTHMPGDLIYLTRTRYYDQYGTASNKLLRILSISKSFSSGRTEITAEEV